MRINDDDYDSRVAAAAARSDCGGDRLLIDPCEHEQQRGGRLTNPECGRSIAAADNRSSRRSILSGQRHYPTQFLFVLNLLWAQNPPEHFLHRLGLIGFCK